jgi:predicted metal-binding membrane protein
MVDGALTIVLWRDRIIVAAALVALTVLAWGYLLWLAADMDMGGMDMTGFRMTPAGMGIMAPKEPTPLPPPLARYPAGPHPPRA